MSSNQKAPGAAASSFAAGARPHDNAAAQQTSASTRRRVAINSYIARGAPPPLAITRGAPPPLGVLAGAAATAARRDRPNRGAPHDRAQPMRGRARLSPST